ncbi:thioredoxin family protein [Pseudidiomarina sp. E22-M8]|uniref:thioredoxin family protein n=1 Tax=Pseudidiomarina sp. E22-M8 TaxID=3424768 RepID=UPI00403CA669
MYRYILFLLLSLSFSSINAAENSDSFFGGLSLSDAQLEQQQQLAAQQNKLFMLVLGADWCHDSRALAKQFQQPEFGQKLAQRFVVSYVDVGYLQHGFSVTNYYGEPTYYGTPTVMIIEPSSGRVLNKSDWQHWTNAASYNEQAFRSYFLEKEFQPLAFSAANRAFEDYYAERVRVGFAVAGALLEAYMESSAKQPSAEFSELWAELGRFRNQVFNDVIDYHDRRDEFPNYPLQSWEQE